jgi:uncharacterized membrane protein YGL010W
MTSSLRSQFADYSEHHVTPGNKACHSLGIPLIVLSLLGLLAQVPLFELGGFQVTLAEAFLVAVTAYYLTLDTGLALMMLAASVVMLAIGRQLSWPWALGLFVFGWALQFVGHYVYEKRSPAFFRNLTHLLVGPLWILAKATGRG